jgi:transposase-like protein
LTASNRYIPRSHLSEAKVRQIVRLFALDLEATKVAALTHVSRRVINRIFGQLRQRMAAACERERPVRGTVEIDESYFGPSRRRGKRGRGAPGKTIVFGVLKRRGRVYTQIVPDVKRATLRAVIRGRVMPSSVVHSDSWVGYQGLVDLGYQKHFRVDHHAHEFARRGRVHINGIESFWSATKTRLARRRGIRSGQFYWHLKECEFRFNHRRANLYRVLLDLVRKSPLK